MNQSNRGAAQVSLMWAIALIVVSLVAISMAWMGQSTIEKLNLDFDNLTVQRDAAVDEVKGFRDSVNEIGKQVGWREAGSTSGPSLTSIQSSIGEFAGVFPSVNPEAKNLQDILPGAMGDYQASLTKASSLQRDLDQVRVDLASRQSEMSNVIRDKDSTIADGARELEDTRNSLNAQVVDAERRYNGLREQYRTLDDRMTAMVSAKEDEVKVAHASALDMKQRNDILTEQLNGVKRSAKAADGAILTAHADLGKAWIDLGRRHRLHTGMEFDVVDASSGRMKGRIRVSSLDENRAEVAILNTVDRFDPIRTDDVVLNAMFDPTRESVAVLLGNGFGGKSLNDMKAMLAELNIRVLEDVTNEADYLILGTPYFDEDTGEMKPWHHFDDYKAAQSMSLEIVHRRDWMGWLGL
jgi:hypothetical protein